MKTELADKKFYFGEKGFPLTVRKVKSGAAASHEHDLTQVKHYHDFCELVAIMSGSGIHWIEGNEYPVVAGDIFLFQGRQKHFFKEMKGVLLYNIMYDPAKLPLPFEQLKMIPGYHAFFLLEPSYRKKHQFKSKLHLQRTTLAAISGIIKRIEEEDKKRSPGYQAAMTALLAELMVNISRQYSSNVKTLEAGALLRIGEVIGAMEQAPEKKWTLGKLAKTAGMSESNLLRVFREATGQTPIENLIHLRIQNAMSLLSETDKPIYIIANETGFADSNYFCRQFRKIAGVSPKKHRENLSSK